jgi:hypothetical protein
MKTNKPEFIPNIDTANEEIERLHAQLEKAGIRVPEREDPWAKYLEQKRQRASGVEPHTRSAEPRTTGAELRGLARAIEANIKQQERCQRWT